jgi:two-component system cell cycle response regulator DivK
MNTDSKKPLILAIDDNEMNLKLLRGIMDYAGYDLEVAESAEEGLEKAKTIKPDLVLMDLHLPEMDGFEATRRLRKHSDYINIPILAVSGYGMAHNQDKLLESGFNGFLQKPIKLQEVLETLAKCLDAKLP